MADSGGNWLNLAEVDKLSVDQMLTGVIDITPKRGGLLTEFPVRQAFGKSTKWNLTNAKRSGSRATVGQELVWRDNVSYTQVELVLRMFYDQTPLNNFIREVHQTLENYETQVLLEMQTGIVETVNDALVYDDNDYDSPSNKYMNGMHHWAVDNSGTDGDIDEGEGVLSLMNARTVMDAGIYGFDYIYGAFALFRYIDSFYQDSGPASFAAPVGRIIYTQNDMGKQVPTWGGFELKRSDYMVAEQLNTGQGSNKRAKYSSGTAGYSMLFIKNGTGSPQQVDPGCVLHFGGESMNMGQVFKYTYFEKLQNYDAAGHRLVAYMNLGVGGPKALCRIHDIVLGTPTA